MRATGTERGIQTLAGARLARDRDRDIHPDTPRPVPVARKARSYRGRQGTKKAAIARGLPAFFGKATFLQCCRALLRLVDHPLDRVADLFVGEGRIATLRGHVVAVGARIALDGVLDEDSGTFGDT